MPDFVTVSIDSVPAVPVRDSVGVRVRRLWRSDDSPSGRRALVLEFDPGAQFPFVDVHEPGPEEVFVLDGVFAGLAGEGSVHRRGDFIHCEVGSVHQPSTATGGSLFVFYPAG